MTFLVFCNLIRLPSPTLPVYHPTNLWLEQTTSQNGEYWKGQNSRIYCTIFPGQEGIFTFWICCRWQSVKRNKSGRDCIQLMITNIKGKDTQEGVTIGSNPCVLLFWMFQNRPSCQYVKSNWQLRRTRQNSAKCSPIQLKQMFSNSIKNK